MKSLTISRLFFLAVTVVMVLGLSLLPSLAEETPSDGKQQPVPAKEQKTTLIQIYSWATILPKELIDLQNNLTKAKSIQLVEEEISGLTKEATSSKKI